LADHLVEVCLASGGGGGNKVQTNASGVRGAADSTSRASAGATEAVHIRGRRARALRAGNGNSRGAEEGETKIQTGGGRSISRTVPAVGTPQRDETRSGRCVLNGVEQSRARIGGGREEARSFVVDAEGARAEVDGGGVAGVGEGRGGNVGGHSEITTKVRDAPAQNNREIATGEGARADGQRKGRVIVDGEAA